MSVWCCGDPGSTHDGDLGKARDLISIAADSGLDACKFQLLTQDQCKRGNVSIDWEWLPDLIEHGNQKGVEVFASVFDPDGHKWLAKCGAGSVKYAYSERHKVTVGGQYGGIKTAIPRVFVSLDVMDADPFVGDGWKFNGGVKLYCPSIHGQALYPVPFQIDFEGIFDRFHGFSSHCLGIKQEIAAVEAGARYLEFHFQGDWLSPCPDSRFAKSPKLTAELVKRIRDIEKDTARPHHVHDGWSR